MKVAVTGGSGQLGTLVLRRLFAEPRITAVVSLDRRPCRLPGRKLTAHIVDIRAPDLQRHLAGCDALIHLAFIVDGRERRALMADVNVTGSENVFRAARAAGVGRIVHMSSVAAFGVVAGHPCPLGDDDPRVYQPEFAYAADKFSVEAFLDDFERANPAIAVVRLRPALMIGSGMENLFGRALRRRLLPYCSDAPLPLVWDEDVADAVMLALLTPARGAFNLAAENALCARDLAAAVPALRARAVARWLAYGLARVSLVLGWLRLAPSFDPAWVSNSDVRFSISSAKALAMLGWRPRCATAADVMRRYCETAARRLDPRIHKFFLLAGMVGYLGPRNVQLAGVHMTIHLALVGPGGGDYGIVVDDGRLLIGKAVPAPPAAVVTVAAVTFRDMLVGTAVWPVAQLTGRVRIEGEASAALVVAGMVSSFRARMVTDRHSNIVVRALSRWMTSGGAR